MRRAFLQFCAVALSVGCLLSPSTASAQSVTEWSSETRTALSLKVNPAALQKLLPVGWVSVPSVSPASPGANLSVTMMERVIVLDPQGKAVRTGTSRYMVLSAAARNAQTGQSNIIIIGGLSPEGAGAYGVYKTATTSRLDRTVTGEAEGYARVQETWEFAAASGERVDLRLTYRRGPATRARTQNAYRSALRPEFQRTYRIDQAADVLRSASTPDRVEQLSFGATGPMLASLFDNAEQILSVSAIPYYVREISIP